MALLGSLRIPSPVHSSLSLFSSRCPTRTLSFQPQRPRAPFSSLPQPYRSPPLVPPLTLEEDEESEEEYEDDLEEGDKLEEEESSSGLQLKVPRGFGVGKQYDTSLEEQLLKGLGDGTSSSSGKRRTKPSQPRQSLPPDCSKTEPASANFGGICVRVSNLPKKKNIHRDLRGAFHGFPGLIGVNPAVSANKKTRDPICKGFAFVHFNSLDAANRFVQTFSEKSVIFGKVEKRIKCAIVEPHQQLTSSDRSSDVASPVEKIIWDGVSATASTAYETLPNSELDIMARQGPDVDGPFAAENSIVSYSSGMDTQEDIRTSDISGRTSSSVPSKKRVVKNKKNTRDKLPVKTSNSSLYIANSRLKYKEKSILNGVIAKYAETASVSLPEK